MDEIQVECDIMKSTFGKRKRPLAFVFFRRRHRRRISIYSVLRKLNIVNGLPFDSCFFGSNSVRVVDSRNNVCRGGDDCVGNKTFCGCDSAFGISCNSGPLSFIFCGSSTILYARKAATRGRTNRRKQGFYKLRSKFHVRILFLSLWPWSIDERDDDLSRIILKFILRSRKASDA